LRSYPLTTNEILTLSALNPISAGLIGWGINTAIAWSAMSYGTDKLYMGIAAIGMLTGGGAIQICSWAFFAKLIWWDCKSSPD
jgi:hypothetical protein